MIPLTEKLLSSVSLGPERLALVDGERRWTYGELSTSVGRVASLLQREKLLPGERVALALENSMEYVAAYYGILAAGGVVVALNIEAKERELTHWLRHCEARWVIADWSRTAVQSALAATPEVRRLLVRPAAGADGLAWDQLSAFTDTEWSPAPRAGSDYAAIIYTSGTTGRPKGVTLTHGNLSANTESILAYLDLTPQDRIVCVLPFFYSYGNSVLHTHLAVGGSVVMQRSMMFPRVVLEQIQAERATGFSGVPSTYALLLARTKIEDFDLSSLRYLTQAGGAMPTAHITKIRELLPNAHLFVMYGQTEATARLSYLPPEYLERKLGSVGFGIPGVALEVRDESRKPVNDMATGEIWATGANIMAGYWNDQELTVEVLRDGWLRTGDMGHRDADGFFYIEGRRSDMIKVGAHRINPQDIEEVIAEMEGVAEVAVVGAPDDILGQVVRAVVVLREGAEITARQIQGYCKVRLADYKVPKIVDFATELPRTASGKIRRFKLSSQEK